MHDLRSLTKDQYLELRKKIRGSISVNSKTVSSKCEVFFKEYPRKKFIMGGVVLKSNVMLQCYYKESENYWKYILLKDLIGKLELLDSIKYLKTRIWLKLWDFSEIYDVGFEPAEAFDLDDIEEGRIIYIIAERIFPAGEDAGFQLIAEKIVPQEDLPRLKDGQSYYAQDDLRSKFYNKDEMRSLIAKELKKDMGFIGEFDNDPMSIIHLFLKERNNISLFEYYCLVEALYAMCKKTQSKELALVMIKYFNIWWSCQNNDGLDKKEWFFSTYKEMKNIVWENPV